MKIQLQTLRKAKRLTQEEVANILDVKLSTYQKYERDAISPPYDTLIKIADFYGVTTDYLLGRKPAPPSPFEKLGLNRAREKSMIEKYMSFPPEVRAVLMDALVKLAESTESDEPERKPTQMTAVKSVDLYADNADSDEDSAQTA